MYCNAGCSLSYMIKCQLRGLGIQPVHMVWKCIILLHSLECVITFGEFTWQPDELNVPKEMKLDPRY
jgi:hypothetical protein